MRDYRFRKLGEPETCRVCGRDFWPDRFDALCCTDTCRKRASRGGAFAYLADLPPRVQRTARAAHAAKDAHIAAHREAVAAKHEVRAVRRKLRELKRPKRPLTEAEAKNLFLIERGRQALLDEQHARKARKIGPVAAILKLFVKERRNDMSAEAIAAMLNSPEDYPVELVAELLAELKASGDYGRIVAATAS